MRISDWSSDVCSSDLPVMVLGIAIGYASADFHRREGLVVQTVIREWMRNDAKLTFLLIEVVCVAALAAYLIEHMFGVDLGVSDRDALAAGLVDRKSTRLNSSH